MRNTGIYLLVGKGLFSLNDLMVRLSELKIQDPQFVIDQVDKNGKWTDGKIKVMALK